ncbi:MAG TPA: SsrA-binding protein SmpB [Candidatus Omnitrophota bacterium]|nr:SsrA-binding protein SmpB [Candidatus Omnitrophota bacterium]HQO59000.1 SsrA-binding protein SmpB [Candidatus Omnitrophota bacterium]HQP12744.1 SsrA-binding protein SmpB [Candidatus Omnitrophota bacterium]
MSKPVATNKKAYHNYFLSQNWECGIELKGGEVKSVRAGLVNFKDSFAKIEDGEVLLYNLHINPYKEASYMNEDPDRARKLLMHKREIRKIVSEVAERGKVLVPTKIYLNNRGLVKIELALGTGKKLYDKRESMKKRDIERSLRQSLRVVKRR